LANFAILRRFALDWLDTLRDKDKPLPAAISRLLYGFAVAAATGGRRNDGNVTVSAPRTPSHMARRTSARPHFQGLSPDSSYAMAAEGVGGRRSVARRGEDGCSS
jgi:hypothetical protein